MINEQKLIKDLLKMEELVETPDFYSIPKAIHEIIDKLNNHGYDIHCWDVSKYYEDDEDDEDV